MIDHATQFETLSIGKDHVRLCAPVDVEAGAPFSKKEGKDQGFAEREKISSCMA
jgi:hypothetical protein